MNHAEDSQRLEVMDRHCKTFPKVLGHDGLTQWHISSFKAKTLREAIDERRSQLPDPSKAKLKPRDERLRPYESIQLWPGFIAKLDKDGLTLDQNGYRLTVGPQCIDALRTFLDIYHPPALATTGGAKP